MSRITNEYFEKAIPIENDTNTKLDLDLIQYAIETKLEDGHIPETLRYAPTASNNSYVEQKLRIYPKYHIHRGVHVKVIDNAIPTKLVNKLYDYTIRYCIEQTKPAWGSYVTIQQIRTLWEQQYPIIQSNNNSNNIDDYDITSQDELSLHTASYFFRNTIRQDVQNLATITTNNDDTNSQGTNQSVPLWLMDDMMSDDENSDVHGIALWALASDVGSSVPYHIDYAELIRYEYGYLIPPVLAGTLQCTPHTVVGGDYCVTRNGLNHYSKYGYKGLLHNKSNEAFTTNSVATSNVSVDDKYSSDSNNKDNARIGTIQSDDIMKDDDGWIRIPFRYNRMICQSGHLPHLSTPVQDIIPMDSTKDKDDDVDMLLPTKRVVIGFNVFLKDIGPAVQQAPEHSDAFRFRVAELRKLSQQNQQQLKSTSLTLEAVKSNPLLASALIKAKREKAKQDFQQAQQQLDEKIQNYLNDYSIQSTTIGDPKVLRNKLITRFARNDGQWPNADDIEVHLKNRFPTIFNTKT